MEEQKREVSFLVFVGFLLLFVLFLFLSPEEKSSGNAIIGSVSLGESPSILTVLILFVILMIILAAVFVILKKLKKKKTSIAIPAKPAEIKSAMEEKKDEKVDFGDGDIEKLFSGGNEKNAKEETAEKAQPTENKVMINLQDLKNKIKMMSSQGITREQITNNLKSRGATIDQVNKAIEEVNLENLKDYVNQALRQGMTKEQIARTLMMHGWKQEQITKVVQ